MEETWKQFEENQNYWVSDLGRVKSFYRGKERILKPILDKDGYEMVYIRTKKTKIMPVHRLVALCFLPKPNYKNRVGHKNLIKTDNRADNLEWLNNKEHKEHKNQII